MTKDHELHARIARSWTDNADAWTRVVRDAWFDEIVLAGLRVVRITQPVSVDTGAPLSLLLQCERA